MCRPARRHCHCEFLFTSRPAPGTGTLGPQGRARPRVLGGTGLVRRARHAGTLAPAPPGSPPPAHGGTRAPVWPLPHRCCPPGAARRARCHGGPSAAAPGRTRGSSRTHVAEAHHRLPFCPCPGCPEVPGIRPRPGYNPNPPRDSQAPSRRYPPSAPPGSHPRPPGCLRGPRRPQSPLPEAGPGARSAQVRGRCRGRGRGASW